MVSQDHNKDFQPPRKHDVAVNRDGFGRQIID